MSALYLSPRQLYEASRLADRLGPAFAHQLDGGRLLLMATIRLAEDLDMDAGAPEH